MQPILSSPKPIRPKVSSSSLIHRLSPLLAAVSLLGTAPLHAQDRIDVPDAMHNPFATDPRAATAGKLLYEQTCQGCHGGEARGDRGPALLGGFKHGASDTDIFQNVKIGIPGTQMPAFAILSSDSIWRIISYLRSLDTSQATKGEKVNGDPSAGEKIFTGKGQCSSCHEVNGRGSVFASDLSAIGNNSAENLTASILHPGAQSAVRQFAPPREGQPRGGGGGNFGATTPVAEIIKIRGGQEISGLRLADDGFAMLMRLPDGSVKRFDANDLVEKLESAKSLMPDDYGNRLSSPELRDLVAYLKTLTGRSLAKTATADIPGGISPDRIVHSAAEPQNWTSYWGNYDGSHFTPLAQITPVNVQHLAPAWSVQMPGSGVLETTPLVIDGVMYTSGMPGQVFALDAKTGQQIWKWERRMKTENPYMTNPYNRGVAVMGNRVFVGTLDSYLIALDARTGRELWEVQLADTMLGYTITAAPLVVKDKVIVGIAGGEFGIRGFLDAYDVRTGKRAWRFNTVPGPGETGHDTWTGDSWKTGSGATWLTGSYDPELNLLYWTTGNPSPALNSTPRGGDNLYTCSVIAFDPDTGHRKWHYQFTPGDTHDWDANEDVVLTDQVVNGAKRKVLIQANRNGMYYVLDRTNGEFLFATPYVTQTWNKGFDKAGRPIFTDAWKSSPQGTVVAPTLTGGANWQNPSYDAVRSSLFVVAAEGSMTFRSAEVQYEPGRQFSGGAPGGGIRSPSSNALEAIDTVTGKIKWKYPLLRRSFAIGVMATKSGLVFSATGEGDVIALDSITGKALWHYMASGNIAAGPMSYSVDGRQYIAIGAGNVLYSFALQP
jgi:alcohol dehydrogenase (cytochrome c)